MLNRKTVNLQIFQYLLFFALWQQNTDEE